MINISFLLLRIAKISDLVAVYTTFIICFLLQVFFWLFFYNKIGLHKEQLKEVSEHPKVTVVICAKNASDTISACLKSVIDQDYPNFNVIVMEDYSTDDTSFKIDAIEKKNLNLKCLRPSKDIVGKKLAILEAVEMADGHWILLTDADCIAISKLWIKTMMHSVDENVDLVLGYGAYLKEKKLVNWLIRYETFYIGAQYLSAALDGKSYMGVGRNMAIRKSTFIEKGIFTNDNLLASGDDDAIVQAIDKGDNVAICTNPKGYTFSKAKTTFLSYFEQKRRHISPSSTYPPWHVLRLSLLGLSHLVFFISGVICFAMGKGLIVLVLIMLRWCLMLFCVKRIKTVIRENIQLWELPILDLMLFVFYLFQLLFVPFQKKNW